VLGSIGPRAGGVVLTLQMELIPGKASVSCLPPLIAGSREAIEYDNALIMLLEDDDDDW
jgi:hypothetical protein